MQGRRNDGGHPFRGDQARKKSGFSFDALLLKRGAFILVTQVVHWHPSEHCGALQHVPEEEQPSIKQVNEELLSEKRTKRSNAH
jgi:hypothetical protein